MGRPRGWSRLYVRHWRVRTKLAAVLLVPSIAFVAVGGLEVYVTFRASQALDSYTDQVALGREVTALVHQLQRERDRTAGALVATDRTRPTSIAVGAFSALTAADWRATNTAADAYTRAAGPVADGASGVFPRHVEAAATALDELPELRTAAAEGQLPGNAVFDGYARIIAALLRVLPGSDPPTGTSGEAPNVRGLVDLAQAKELQSQVRGRLQAAAQAGRFAFGDQQTFTDLRARRSAALDRFRGEADATQLAVYEEVTGGPAPVTAARLERGATDNATLTFDADEWWAASTAQVDAYRTAERRITDRAVRASGRFSDAATTRTRIVAGLVAALLIAALLTSFVVGRSMAGSLRRLRRRALVAAQHDLPEAIRVLSTATVAAPDVRIESPPVDSADEIGEVATAFDAVHHQAIRLATEQAALRRDVSGMFVNLARRSQVLVGRQLALLDELEADERDPDRLSKFFALDHLATRMRRNDESLLVLAASESHRLWREPVPLSKVLLGAVAETEHYERVEANGPSDVVVAGHVVPDLLHLLAELLDNATAFSPPEAPVLLTARMIRGADGAEAVITVEDSGMGMTQSMLADANQRLAEPAAIDVAVSERMGHFVVSRLAARHSMRVELQGAAGGGVTASVRLPTGLLSLGPARSEPEPVTIEGELDESASLDGDTQPLPIRPVDGDTTDLAAALDAAPVSPAAPVEAAPGSPAPVSPAPVNAVAVEAAPVSPAPVSPAPLLARRTPAASSANSPGGAAAKGGWWSGDGSGWRAPAPPPSRTSTKTSSAGLPVRVPRASASPAPAPATIPRTAEPHKTEPNTTDQDTITAPPPAEPDEVGSTLAAFHSGIRRADDEDPAPCNN